MTDVKIRLQKFMAESGVASRRKSEELIAAGKVKVNGKTACVGDKVNPKPTRLWLRAKSSARRKKTSILCLINREDLSRQ